MKKRFILVSFSTLILLFFTNCSVTKKAGISLEDQVKEIMQMWPGSYNNNKQISKAEAAGESVWRADDSGEGGFLNVYSHYIALDRPDIGSNVLYVEEYRDNDPSVTYRQRIYTINVDKVEGKVKVKMWPFKDKKKYIGAYKDLSLLDQLTKEEISAYPDKCDLHVSKNGQKYHMYMNGKECAFGDKYFNYEVMLSKNRFSYRDKIMQLSTDSLLTTAANFAWHSLDAIKK